MAKIYAEYPLIRSTFVRVQREMTDLPSGAFSFVTVRKICLTFACESVFCGISGIITSIPKFKPHMKSNHFIISRVRIALAGALFVVAGATLSVALSTAALGGGTSGGSTGSKASADNFSKGPSVDS
jgi:hypothetical protein